MFSQILKLMITAVRKQSSFIARDFGELENMQHSPKLAQEFAFQANKRLQQHIHADLKKFRSAYSYKFKDSSYVNNQDSSNYFVINGIVGISNLINSIPNFVINIYLQRDNAPLAAVVYNPITNEMFYAEKDHGAFYNQKPIRYQANLSKSLVLDRAALKTLTDTNNNHNALYITRCPILDLCYLASNKYSDCHLLGTLNYQHVASGILIAEEANVMLSYKVDHEKSHISQIRNEK